MKQRRVLALAAAMAATIGSANAAGGGTHGLAQRQAMIIPGATDAMLLGATTSGARIVAVGDRGIILLSDDGGASFRQAKAVPTRATLTSVHFVDNSEGWAAGHWGVILHTTNGGETWTLQREDLANDRPLFSVWFRDSRLGLATGLWGLVLGTEDGGVHWNQVQMPPAAGKSKATDSNLLAIFPGPGERVYIAAERGSVFRSDDNGARWTELHTGNPGSFWTGLSLASGTIVVAGLRGHICRSTDQGAHWDQISTPTKSSITSLAQLPSGDIVAIGLDGVSLRSSDDGRSFTAETSIDREALTAVTISSGGAVVLFSAHGPISGQRLPLGR